MIALLAAVLAAVGALGVVLIVHGLRPIHEPQPARRMEWRPLRARAGLAVVLGSLGWVATGWPAVGAMTATVGAIAPSLLDARRARIESQARTDALAGWAEMLRDTIRSHAGLREAIGVTAPVAPEAIRGSVQRLAARAERESLSVGLRRFGQEVEDPIGDLIVAALSVAADGQARNLPALLSEIASSARAEAHMRMRVETGRARTYSSSRALVIITLGLSASLLIFASDFMRPFASFWGQLVLLVITGLFGGAVWGLIALGRPATSPRLLAGVTERWAEAAP